MNVYYSTPKMEISILDVDDVISTSGKTLEERNIHVQSGGLKDAVNWNN